MKTTARILLTDDESGIRRALREILEFEGYEVLETSSGEEALTLLEQRTIDLMFLDVKMQGIDGLEVLQQLRAKGYSFPVIMLTGHGNIDTAVQSTRLGAFDFLQKPPDLNRLLISVRNALERNSLYKENRSMRRRISNVSEILGNSKAINHIRETIKRVAPTDARVLITGENGTGKELVARWLHELSKRTDKPLVEVNCAAIPAELLESELFGHEKGSFTGAVRQRIGKFEQAHGGTLFLDEIGDMPLSSQAKVLRALQEGQINRVGGTSSIQVDVRVIAATNKNLAEEIKQDRFREDLFHRLNVIPVHVPPLRERADDIPVLAEAFLEQLAAKDIIFADKSLNEAAIIKLQKLPWTGNVRELHNVIERLGILTQTSEIDEHSIDLLVMPAGRKEVDHADPLNEMIHSCSSFHDFKEAAERAYLVSMLNKNDWNISNTADHIGIQRSHMYNKMKKYHIER
ncbi:MAG: sigma-54-dependent Fis family transcriptional regulator [Bacteroidetes bacterium]|nr:sigma-54-dependent Fis family transcriptional regulator [Bacteroidota bacterium]MCH8523465.1 sigma-54 dependent transcriptional regulator [Balneolales bacterium]